MNADGFFARVRRALRRPPRYVVRRVMDAAERRSRRLRSRIVPRLLNDRALLNALGAPDIDTLWADLARQPFFIDSTARQSTAERFVQTYPDAREPVLRAADAVLRHEFDLLGSGPQSLGMPLPWHDDFKTGKRWPLIYGGAIEYNELDRPTDVKVPWELSRCQHFTTLGQAFWLSGDDRFAQEYVDEITDWIARNPYGYGVNWACAMDVALRAVSWIWGFFFFADAAPCQSREFRRALLRALYLHGEYVTTYLERGDLNGNHFLTDGVGLVFLGCFFKATRKGQSWLALGKQIVFDEILIQVTPDGVDFEQSTAYHRLVLEAFATAYMLLERHGEPIPSSARERLEKMYEFAAAYIKPDGRAPLIGDADDGRIQILGGQPIGDHRYLLSTAAVAFSRLDFKAAAGRFWEESFWLLGPSGLDAWASVPSVERPAVSQAFSDGGFYVLRSDTAHVVVDCGEVGMRGRGGHGHNDMLSFELFLDGLNVITDCGAYLYTASREWRNRFRSTAFHNTIEIDAEEVNRFIGPDALWTLHYDAVPSAAALVRGAGADRFAGGHRGYERLSDPVTVTRELVLDRTRPRLAVRDSLTGLGSHDIVWRFHLDPDIRADLNGVDVRLSSGTKTVWLLPDCAAAAFAASLEPGWVSPSYGVKRATTVVVWRARTTVPVTAGWLFAETRLTAAEREQTAAELRNRSLKQA